LQVYVEIDSNDDDECVSADADSDDGLMEICVIKCTDGQNCKSGNRELL